MLSATSRLLGLAALGLLPACSTYSSLDDTLGAVDVMAGGDAGGSAGAAAGGGAGDADAGGSAGSKPLSGGTGGGGAAGSASAGMAGSSGSGGSGSGGATLEPTGLTLSAETTGDLVRELNTNGTLYTERCPENQVLIGFGGTVDAPGGKGYLRSAQAICGQLSVSEGEPWQVLVTAAEPLPMHEIESAQMQMALCPANQVMVGFAGRSGLWMDSVDVRCAPLNILGASPTFLLVAGTASKAGTIGGTTGGSPFDPLECPAGDIAVAQIILTIQGGVVLGAFGVKCATPTLTVE